MFNSDAAFASRFLISMYRSQLLRIVLSVKIAPRNVGYALMDLFRAGGHTVVDCTNDYAATTNENLSEICRLANAQPLDLFVSIHFNSAGGHGTEVFTYNGQRHPEAVAVCEKLHELGFVNRGVKSSNLYVINRTNAKAMLIEVCFVDTKSDVDLYHELGAEKVAAAIYEAITGAAAPKTNTETEESEVTKKEYDALIERVEKLEKPMIYDYMDENMPEWARTSVQKAIDRGIVQGVERDENGNILRLGLTETDLKCIVREDRAGLYD